MLSERGSRPAEPWLRSCLYVPGTRLDWVARAVDSGADAIVLDLEDSVAASAKERARRDVAALLDGRAVAPSGPYLLVRVNPWESGLTDADLDAVIWGAVLGVLLPKVRSRVDVERLDARLSSLESARGLTVGSILIRPMLESALGLQNVFEIAGASNRVAYIGAGGAADSDFARAIGYRATDGGLETLYIRSRVLLAARAAAIPFPMTSAWFGVRDLDGLRRYANRERNIGYMGMFAIHPSHVAIANEIFGPSRQDLERWSAIVQAVQDASRRGTSVAVVGGAMVDSGHADYATMMLTLAARLRPPTPADQG